MTPEEVAQKLEEAHRQGRLSNPYDSPLTSPVLLGAIAAAPTAYDAIQIAIEAGISRVDLMIAGLPPDPDKPDEVVEYEERMAEVSAANVETAKDTAKALAIEQAQTDPNLLYDQEFDRFLRMGGITENGQVRWDIVEPDWQRAMQSGFTEISFRPIDSEGGSSYITTEPDDLQEFRDSMTTDLPPLEGQYQLLGRPPEGFVPGVGFQNPELEPEEQRQAEIDRALASIERIRRGSDRFPGSLVGGKGEFAHELDQLSTFTDGGTLEARYYEGEEWQWSWRSAGEVRILQQRLENAGLLKPNNYIPGMWDPTSATAMAKLMAESNNTGVTWEMQLSRRLEMITPEMLEEIYGSSSRASTRSPFVAPAYMKPDQASLSQAVKTMVRQRLRREPSDRDMAELTQQMQADYLAEYQAQVAALRSEYDAQTRALDTGESQGGAVIQNVDPTARFREAFESRFANEIQLRDDTDDMVEQTGRMQSAMQRFDSMIGL